MKKRRILSLFCLIAIIAGMFAGCAAADRNSFQTAEDFAQARIGVMTGSVFDLLANEHYPESKLYHMNMANLILNLKQEKIDGVLMDMGYYAPLIWNNEALSFIEMDMPATEYAVAFPKTPEAESLAAQINEFIRTQTENGWLAQQEEKWFSDTEPDGTLDFSQLTGENGTLRVAATVECIPFDYLQNEQYSGYDADFIYRFAEAYGYALEIDLVTFDVLLPGLAAQRYDLALSGITVTEERKESVLFSDVYYKSPIVMAIMRDNASAGTPKSMADLENGSFAILTGTIWDGVAQEKFPNAQRKHFSSMTDITLALEQGKVDAILGDKTFYVNARWENVPVTILDDTIETISCAFMLARDTYDPVLYDQLNTFITQSEQDGTLDALYNKWLSDAEPAEHPDYESLTGENGTLKIAVDNTAKPMTYQKGNQFTGYDVELLTEFARAYGYRLEFMGMSFSALIPSISSGKCDIGACGIANTPERAESVTFTTTYEIIEGVAIVCQTASAPQQNKFAESITDSFEKTFIRENRWKLILEGIGVTMLISLCAAFAGTLLGFGLYMLSRADSKLIRQAAKGVGRVYSRFIAGTPIVVILMILFYVIFGKIRDMSGIVVAVIGFTLTFGAFVYDHMTVSVGSVAPGQTEAAYALGYPKNQAFFRIIFPQAMTIFLPSYCGQAVELIKATAVVGYIAVNDLTKMGDIIRSNTYEAFFPLIATAVIYFLLTWLLSALLGRVQRHFEPKRRSKEEILKDVKTV